jgi:hypothetical protein
MPRGSSPGEHRGGRTAGKPNKVSTARVERAVAEGKKLPPDELLRNAENCRAMAMSYAPRRTSADTNEVVENPQHNEERYSHWLAAERDALKAAAPYYAPRLMAMAVQTATLDRDKELRGDPRVALLEMILQMRDRDEIGQQQALPAPKGNGHGEIIDAVVAKVVEEDDEDNGDGEAA